MLSSASWASLVDSLQSLPGACGLSCQKVDQEPSMLDICSTSGFGDHSCDVGTRFPRIYSRASLVLRHLCHKQRLVSGLREGSVACASFASLGSGASLEQQLHSSLLASIRAPLSSSSFTIDL